MNKKHTHSFREEFQPSPCSCAADGLWSSAPHSEFLFIMFHHGTRGKAEDRTFLEPRLHTLSLVGNLLTPVTSNVLSRYSVHMCIHIAAFGPLPGFAYLLLSLYPSLFAFLRLIVLSLIRWHKWTLMYQNKWSF